MKRFAVTLGSLTFTPGHKHSCAQLAASFVVDAETADDALQAVRDCNFTTLLRGDGRHRQAVIHGDGAGAIRDVTFAVNPAFISKRGTRVQEIEQ